MDEAWHSKLSINTKHENLNYLFGINAVLCLLIPAQEGWKEGRERAGQKGSLFRRASCNMVPAFHSHSLVTFFFRSLFIFVLFTAFFQHFSAYRWVMRHEGEVLSVGPHRNLVSRRVSLALG